MQDSTSKQRVRLRPKYQSFVKRKRIKYNHPELPNTLWMIRKIFSYVNSNKWLWFRLAVIFMVINYVVVNSFKLPINISNIQTQLKDSLGEGYSRFGSSVAFVGVIIGGGNEKASTDTTVYQSISFVIFGLVVIYLMRLIYASKKPTLSDVFYKSQTALIPFVLVMLIMALTLIPYFVGNFIFGIVIDNGYAVGFMEQTAWLIFFVGLLYASAYMFTGAFMALIIVTLPGSKPIASVDSANKLTKGRKMSIMLKFITFLVWFGGAFLLLVFASTLISQTAGAWVYYIGINLMFLFFVMYVYVLYRNIL